MTQTGPAVSQHEGWGARGGRQLMLLPLRSVLLVDVENVGVRRDRMAGLLRALRAAAGPVDAAFVSGAETVLVDHAAACRDAGLRVLPAFPGVDGADRALMEVCLHDCAPGATVYVASCDGGFADLAAAGLNLVVLTPPDRPVARRLRACARAALAVTDGAPAEP